MPLFHRTYQDLNEETIIQPGRWGKIIFETGPTHICWNREITLESIRVNFFPSKPSRLKSTFCCENLETIHYFKDKHCPEGFIYEIEIIDEAMAKHKGDFNAVEPLPGRTENIFQIATLYWKYELKTSVIEWPGVECSEIVSASPLRVLRKID